MLIPSIILLLFACFAFGRIDTKIGYKSYTVLIAFITLFTGSVMMGMWLERHTPKPDPIKPKTEACIKETVNVKLNDSTTYSIDTVYILKHKQ